MLKFLFELFLLYLLYKLVFDFIIPVYRVSRQMREHMARRQQENHSAQNRENKPTQVSKERTDYIEFEEIKD